MYHGQVPSTQEKKKAAAFHGKRNKKCPPNVTLRFLLAVNAPKIARNMEEVHWTRSPMAQKFQASASQFFIYKS